mgnify:CR=1 FL=1
MDRTSFEMEFIFRASPTIIYKFLTDASCLIRWFCDEVDIEKGVFTYSWDGAEEIAKLTENTENEFLRFEWEDRDAGEPLEIKLKKSPVTGETVLELKDYCDADEVDEQKQLWNTQFAQLRRETGG